MFTQLFTTIILAAALVRADVNPTTPDGSSVYKEGDKCQIAWTGDASGEWSDMTIQLMSGDNYQMVPTTTVATGQDGNKDGTYEYTCPEVTPNSKIYFYQFTAPASKNTTWTTRWTLAAADGSTTEPANSTQPGGAEIAWGVGALDDAFASSAAPAGQSSVASGSVPSTSSTSQRSSASAGESASSDAASSDAEDSTTSHRASTTKTSNAANASSTSEPDAAANMIGSRSLQALAAGVLLAMFL